MRLRTYAAPTVSEAMALVRQEMGDDAIIVSTQSTVDGLGARVTAAVEDIGIDDPRLSNDLDVPWPDDASAWTSRPSEPSEPSELGEIEECLSYHGVPDCFIDRLSAVARLGNATPESTMLALASVFEGSNVLRPLDFSRSAGTYILVGMPGAGKTITTAKLVVDAFKQGRPIRVVNTDVHRAGAMEQLRAFMRIIDCDVTVAKTPGELERISQLSNGVSIFIDTPSVNPFDQRNVAFVSELIAASHATPILVLSAGIDPYECADDGAIFSEMGVGSIVATRLDAARRLGGLLSPPLATGLKLCATSASGKVAESVSPINPVSFARLFLAKMSDATSQEDRFKVRR